MISSLGCTLYIAIICDAFPKLIFFIKISLLGKKVLTVIFKEMSVSVVYHNIDICNMTLKLIGLFKLLKFPDPENVLNLMSLKSIFEKILIIIDCETLANQGENSVGSVRPCLCVCLSLQQSAITLRFGPNNDNYQSEKCVCFCIQDAYLDNFADTVDQPLISDNLPLYTLAAKGDIRLSDYAASVSPSVHLDTSELATVQLHTVLHQKRVHQFRFFLSQRRTPDYW